MKLCKLTVKELEQRLASQERKNFSRDEQVDNLMKTINLKDEQKFSNYQKETQNLNEKLKLKVISFFSKEKNPAKRLQNLYFVPIGENMFRFGAAITRVTTTP